MPESVSTTSDQYLTYLREVQGLPSEVSSRFRTTFWMLKLPKSRAPWAWKTQTFKEISTQSITTADVVLACEPSISAGRKKCAEIHIPSRAEFNYLLAPLDLCKSWCSLVVSYQWFVICSRIMAESRTIPKHKLCAFTCKHDIHGCHLVGKAVLNVIWFCEKGQSHE